MFPIPTPCKGKSKNQSFAHTFALTGRRRLCIDTQGVAMGSGLTALSGRSFSRFVRLSCAHALPLVVWQKNAQRFFCILNTLPFRALLFALCSFIMCACFAAMLFGSKKRAVATDSRTRPSILSTRHRSACASRLADLGSNSPLWDRRGGNCA